MLTWRLSAALWPAAALLHLGPGGPHAVAQAPWDTAPTVSKPIIGTLDPADRSALVFVGPGGGVFGVCIAVEYAGVRLASPELADAAIAFGPRGPDGSYAETTWRFPRAGAMAALASLRASPPPDVRFRWGRQGGASAIALFDVSAPCDIVLEPCHPFGIMARYRLSSTFRGFIGWSGTVLAGAPVCHFRLEVDRRSRTPSIEQLAAGRRLTVRFRLSGGERLALRAQVGAKAIGDLPIDADAAEAALDEALGQLEQQRARLQGPVADAVDALGSSLFRLVAYRPGSGSTYIASEMPPGSGPVNISGPDAWLSALAAAVQSKARAYDIIYTLCETQTVTGCIPGFVADDGQISDWSQPPLGSYCVLKLYERFGDKALLEYAYPRLLRWYRWWLEGIETGSPRRDGNGDGLLEWGGDTLGDARRESAMPEGPLWDDAGFDETTRTMTLNAIDLNSFRALDAWCLARMAEALKRPEEAKALARDYELMRDRVNAALWDDREGLYFSRHWDGRLPGRKTLASFYPLIAGIPTRQRADSLAAHLLNVSRFGGEWLLPTLSRDDPAYDPAAPCRGAISPVANYIVYEGLKGYGYDTMTAELAQRSAALFRKGRDLSEGWRNWYDASTGAGMGERFQRAGALLPLMAVGETVGEHTSAKR